MTRLETIDAIRAKYANSPEVKNDIDSILVNTAWLIAEETKEAVKTHFKNRESDFKALFNLQTQIIKLFTATGD